MPERIDIEIRGKADSAVSAAQATERALKGVNEQSRAAASSSDRMAGAAGKAADNLESVRRAGEPAQRILSGIERAASGGAGAIRGFYDVLSGLFGTLRAGFGPAGIIATAAVVVGTLAAKLLDTKKPAEDTAESVEKLAEAARKLEQAKLDDLKAGFQELGKLADAANKRFDEALERRRRLTDAEGDAEIASIKAKQRAGSLTERQAGEQISAIQLERELRNAGTPAEKARIQANAANETAGRARTEEEQIAGRTQRAGYLAGFFEQDIAKGEARRSAIASEITRLERDERGRGTVYQQAETEKAIRALIDEDTKLASEIETARKNQATQRAAYEAAQDELIKATERRAEAEAAAAAATERANKELETAKRIQQTIRDKAEAEASTFSAGSAGRSKTGRTTFDSSVVPYANIIEVGGKPYVPPPVNNTTGNIPGATPLAPAPAPGTAIIRDKDGNIIEIPARADGGPVKKDEPTLVGERGAEVFTPIDDGIISSNREATSGRYAPTAPIGSNAEALAISAANSAARAAVGRGGFDGSDRANARAVRDFSERDPSAWSRIVQGAMAEVRSSASHDAVIIQKQNAEMIKILREIYFQAKNVRVA